MHSGIGVRQRGIGRTEPKQLTKTQSECRFGGMMTARNKYFEIGTIIAQNMPTRLSCTFAGLRGRWEVNYRSLQKAYYRVNPFWRTYLPAAIPVAPSIPSTVARDPALPNAEVTPSSEKEIRIYGHSTMFYWWPVWTVGFLMAALTYMDGHVLAVVPQGTQVESGQVLPGDTRPRDILVAPSGETVPAMPGTKNHDSSHRLLVAANNNYGAVFVGILLLVVVVSNFIFRGLVSVVVVAGMTAYVGSGTSELSRFQR